MRARVGCATMLFGWLAACAAPPPPTAPTAEDTSERAARRAQAIAAYARRPEHLPAQRALVEAYFPELGAAAAGEGSATLAVTLPRDGEPLTLTTRGYRVRVHGALPVGALVRDGVLVAGDQLWLGSAPLAEQSAVSQTHRLHQVVLRAQATGEHRASWELELPAGLTARRELPDHLELRDAAGVPVLRLHHMLARDARGQSRAAEVTVRELPGAHRLRVDWRVSLAGLLPPVVIDPGWSATSTLATARTRHAAVLLIDGRVLVAGGYDGESEVATAELYDPRTDAWTTANSSMSTARMYPTAVGLGNGQVLVCGGVAGSAAAATCDLFDPRTASFTHEASFDLPEARSGHTLTLMPDNTVLAVGGKNASGAVVGVAQFNPAARTWTSILLLSSARHSHTVTLLPDGALLVAGGLDSTNAPLDSAVKLSFNMTIGSWMQEGPIAMAAPRALHTATVLDATHVLFAGGRVSSSSITNTWQLFDIGSATFATLSAANGLPAARERHTATRLPSGLVLFAGGAGDGGAPLGGGVLFDPTAIGSAMPPAVAAGTNPAGLAGRLDATATLLPSGEVLLVGGEDVNHDASAEAYRYSVFAEPAQARVWRATPALELGRTGHSATLLEDGRVLVVGGLSGTTYLTDARIFDPVLNTWQLVDALPTGEGRYQHTATLLTDGTVLVAGGVGSNVQRGNAFRFDPSSGTWSAADTLHVPRSRHCATLLPTGELLVAGGWDGSQSLASVEIFSYQGTSFNWVAAADLHQARRNHAAAAWHDGRVLVIGGYAGAAALASVEAYDVTTDAWTPVATLAQARHEHTATLTADGRLLVVGGKRSTSYLPQTELFDGDSWRTGAPLTVGRARHSATLLPDGELVVFGGLVTDSSATATVEVLRPGLAAWSNVPPGNGAAPPAARSEHSATLMATGDVLIAGGHGATTDVARLRLTGAGDNQAPRPTLFTEPTPGSPLQLTGSGFRGAPDFASASGDTCSSSATPFPLFVAQQMQDGRLIPAVEAYHVGTYMMSTTFQGTVRLPTEARGTTLVWLIVNGLYGAVPGVRLPDGGMGMGYPSYRDEDGDGYPRDGERRYTNGMPVEGWIPWMGMTAFDCADLPGSDPACGGLDGAECYPMADDYGCDGIDNDCDGTVDNYPDQACFPDTDGDGHGAEMMGHLACTCLPGSVTNNDDCDDTTPLHWSDCQTCPDADGDDYGVPHAGGDCNSAADCDDFYCGADCFPGNPAPDACDGFDQDCDVAIDEDFVPTSCGLGVCAAQSACDNGVLSPCVEGAPTGIQICNGLDDDCNGSVDDEARCAELACHVNACDPAIPACVATRITGCCVTDDDCSANPCYDADCDDGVCRLAPLPCGCTGDGDCDDGNSCTANACLDGTCSLTPLSACCQTHADCDDGLACTYDLCDASQACLHRPSGCDDDNPCADTPGCAYASLQVARGGHSPEGVRLTAGEEAAVLQLHLASEAPPLTVERLTLHLRDADGAPPQESGWHLALFFDGGGDGVLEPGAQLLGTTRLVDRATGAVSFTDLELAMARGETNELLVVVSFSPPTAARWPRGGPIWASALGLLLGAGGLLRARRWRSGFLGLLLVGVSLGLACTYQPLEISPGARSEVTLALVDGADLVASTGASGGAEVKIWTHGAPITSAPFTLPR